MISLKRNSKLELVEAPGKRIRASSIYTPAQSKDFKLSRGKFSNFITCPRCFYLDRVKGLAEPGMPGWTLNETTDHLLKKEFDECRQQQKPHRLFSSYGLDHIVPFDHPSMDDWRNSLHKGLMVRYKDSNIILSGGVDDIWFNTQTETLIVVDYKSQANRNAVETKSYLASPYHEGYKMQMDFYNYLLDLMEFPIGDISYFLVVNANRAASGFHGVMEFEETIVPYQHDISWIDERVQNMIDCMNSDKLPESNISCENCAYARQRKKLE
jgi:hypothetical protein